MPALVLQVLRRENELLKLMRYHLSASGQKWSFLMIKNLVISLK